MKKDRPMYADDMFLKGVQQVFSVRTGEFIGYYRPGELSPVEQETTEEQQQPEDPAQIKMKL